MAEWMAGQRCLSETEPELGLGTVQETDARTVRVLFPASGASRQYALESAPLQRVRFRPGDQLRDQAGRTLTVERVTDRNGLLVYGGSGWELPERELSDLLSFNQPEERLRYGQLDESAVFDLRLETWRQQHRVRRSGLRGFLGGRISLIPHQLFIAQEVAGRLAPRVLLADEVGLGKTIEACLIVHRLLLTGRAARVLVVVPEPLLHQWFVELLRRFNLTFRLFDEERCASIEASQPGANPFLDDQLILAALGFLSGNPKRRSQIIEAGWDLVVVDEAHHLAWTPEVTSAEYDLVQALARRTEGLLLLTATPEQLGETGHFARLRLLDPDRYYDYPSFLRESAHYLKVVRVVEKLLDHKRLTQADRRTLLFPGEAAEFEQLLAASAQGDEPAGEELIEDLLDRHGTGRVMFRNMRATMTGFPKRVVRPAPLQPGADPAALLEELRREFRRDLDPAASGPAPAARDFRGDPRLPWLVDLLRRLGSEKILLICRTRAKVEALDAALRERINVKAGLFHEEMTLLQRDRSAAWFAEEDGARVLLCSEIGSEGRNFQFAHHLVLFDLPLDPGLLEQRIGRLDRIGQTATIRIHVPYVPGAPQEILFRWFHEGMNAFEQSPHDALQVFERFGPRVQRLAQKPAPAPLEKLLRESRAFHETLTRRLAQGRDRLLELSSFRDGPARHLVDRIGALDQDRALEEFVHQILDHFGIQVDDLSAKTMLLGAGDLQTDAIPALPAEGLVVTCDRARALEREDIGFLSWDHPILTGIIDLLLGSTQGTSAFAIWETEGPATLLLEALFILECPAPEKLHVDRFLPPTPVRVLVDHQRRVVTDHYPPSFPRLRNGSVQILLARPDLTRTLLPRMLEVAFTSAEQNTRPLLQSGTADLEHKLGHELARLRALRQVNPNVRQDEIDLTEEQLRTIREHLTHARLRLDALRLIWKGPLPAAA